MVSNRDDLIPVFQGSALIKDESGVPMGRGMRERDFLDQGYTKPELRKLVKAGILEMISCADPSVKGLRKPVINVVMLKGYFGPAEESPQKSPS